MRKLTGPVDVSRVIIWTVVEANVIMIAACVPALHPVYDKFRKRMEDHRSIGCASGTPPDGQARWDSRRGFWTVVMMRIGQVSGTTLNTATENSRSVVSAATPSQWNRGPRDADEKDAAASNLGVPMRSLEDAASIQHPPDAIWTQRANGARGVGRLVAGPP